MTTADEGAAGPGERPGLTWDGRAQRTRDTDQQWLLTFLPTFPVLLLVLRLWYLSRQDVPTMLLLVQHASPLSLVSALITTLLWVLPVGILVVRALGAVLRVSVPGATGSRLARASRRMPDWVLALAVMLAALTWQLRFLPTLLMLTLVTVVLEVRTRAGYGAGTVHALGFGVPLAAAVAGYAWLAPGITAALHAGEETTALLLLAPPALTVLLTGPLPQWPARILTHWAALVAALLAPFLVGAAFVRTPVLPLVALEIDPAPGERSPRRVLAGHVIDVDDRMTSLLDRAGTVRFVLNEQVVSKVLCPDATQIPYSAVRVRGWQVEQSVLQWLAPRKPLQPPDPRCQGRTVSVPAAPAVPAGSG